MSDDKDPCGIKEFLEKVQNKDPEALALMDRINAENAARNRGYEAGKRDAFREFSMVARLRTLQATSTSPFVFPAQLGGLLHRFKTHYFKAVRKAGLAGTKLGVHTLRHTWASRMVEAGADLLLLQKLGGWSSLLLVQRYSHLREERGAEAIRRMVEARPTPQDGADLHQLPHRRATGRPRTA